MLSVPALPDPGRVFSQFELFRRSRLVLAVSGGGDSLALLLMLKEYLDRRAAAPRLLAVTVDHQLRPESADEARMVAEVCAARGIGHRTMRWAGGKPASGLPAAARAARLRLLAEAAGDAGADTVLTGHTLDDQVETVRMRRARGAGRGEAGIAPASLYEGRIWFVRPLLGMRREALRDYLRRAGAAWIDDPTNEDVRFERTRTRKVLDETEIEALARRAGKAAAAREALGMRAAALIEREVVSVTAGLFRLSETFFAGEDREAGIYALRILLAAAGGREQLPDAERAARLFARLRSGEGRATLSRAVIDKRPGGTYLRREARGLPMSSAAVAGALWDGRYRFEKDAPEKLTVAPFGRKAAEAAELGASAAPPGLARAALAVEPALWRDGKCVGSAAEEGLLRPVAAPWARLLPSFDLAPARSVGRVLGAAVVPLPPFAGHNGRRSWANGDITA